MHKYFHLASVSLLFSFWKAVVSSEIGIKESKRGCMVILFYPSVCTQGISAGEQDEVH